MPQPSQTIDPFTAVLMDQRNNALNEAAYWKAEAIKAQAAATELQAKLSKKKPSVG